MEDSATRYQALVKSLKETPQYRIEMLKLTVAEDICRYMDDRGISRTELAKNLGTSKAYITKVLRGTSNLTLDSLVRIYASLGCDLHIHPCEKGFEPPRLSVFTSTRNAVKFNEQSKGIDKNVNMVGEISYNEVSSYDRIDAA